MAPPDPTPKDASPLTTGCALIFIGILALVPSGLCTGFFVVMAISNNEWNELVVPLLFGGPFVLGGAVILWYGARNFVRYSEKSDDD